jgi:cytochrome c
VTGLSFRGLALAWSAALLGANPALSDEINRGRALFEPCRACHSLVSDAKAMAGPNLSGLIGRRVGGAAAFDYSPVLRQAGAQGRRWDRQLLDAFLVDPEAVFPGLWMTGPRMARAADRQALIRFLTDPASR